MKEIQIIIETQTLIAIEDGQIQRVYTVSTALNGVGEQQGSEQTPRGKHIIRAKIGAGLPSGSILVSRRPTGAIYTPDAPLQRKDPILSRILWLSGLEVGHNRLGSVDTMRRYIYIHGTPDTEPMGIPRSHGCIRMRNEDIIELFDWVEVRTPVEILETGTE